MPPRLRSAWPGSMAVVFAATLVAQSPQTAAPTAPAATVGARALVGTWIPATFERLAADGTASAVTNARGLLVFDGAGHVLEIVTRGNRVPFAAPQPTPAEARMVLENYGGFWGSYRLDGQRQRIAFKPDGAVQPAAMGAEFGRSFTLSGDRLTISSLPGEPGLTGAMRWTWQRVPELENLSATHRRLIGFWQHVMEQRVATSGAIISENRRAPSVIVYTPAGYVGVHFVPLNRKPFAAEQPTDDEARAAIAGYVGYFGVYDLYPGAVYHHRLAVLNPAQNGDTLRRFYEIDGDRITLRFPPGVFQGTEQRTIVTLRRLSGAAEMLP